MITKFKFFGDMLFLHSTLYHINSSVSNDNGDNQYEAIRIRLGDDQQNEEKKSRNRKIVAICDDFENQFRFLFFKNGSIKLLSYQKTNKNNDDPHSESYWKCIGNGDLSGVMNENRGVGSKNEILQIEMKFVSSSKIDSKNQEISQMDQIGNDEQMVYLCGILFENVNTLLLVKIEIFSSKLEKKR